MLANSVTTVGVEFEIKNGWGWVNLCKPSTLNALDLAMVLAIRLFLTKCESDASVEGVVITSRVPNVFSAGGDIKAVYHAYTQGNNTMLAEYLYEEYGLNQQIEAYPKPVVAVMEGITLGGGVGLSRYAKYRIATPTARMGMPEIKIAFFPDVGAGYFLNLLDKSLSRFLMLTGYLVSGIDAVNTGYATHIVDSVNIDKVLHSITTNNALDPVQSKTDSNLTSLKPVIDCFAQDNLIACLDQLKVCEHAEALKFYNEIQQFSPMALSIVWHYMNVTRSMSLSDVFALDYKLAVNMFNKSDFMEGIRTRLVNKHDAPCWQHESIAAVQPSEVESYFVSR